MKVKLDGFHSHLATIRRLELALEESRFPQALLLEGPVGIGKKNLVQQVAKALSCTDTAERPCGKCFSCRSSSDPDESPFLWMVPAPAAETSNTKSEAHRFQVVADFAKELRQNPLDTDLPEAKNMISVTQVRDLQKKLMMKSTGVRVVIVPHVEKMNESAANAFLKTLEEADGTWFLLTTATRSRLLPTILSRCLRVSLTPLSPEEVAGFLKIDLADPVLRQAGGSVGLARKLAGEGHRRVDELARSWVENIAAASLPGKIMEIVECPDLSEIPQALNFLACLQVLISDALRKTVGIPTRSESLCFPDAWQKPEGARIALEQVRKAQERIGKRANIAMALGSLGVALAGLDRPRTRGGRP